VDIPPGHIGTGDDRSRFWRAAKGVDEWDLFPVKHATKEEGNRRIAEISARHVVDYTRRRIGDRS
jgi:hypothetical protein